MQIEPWGWVVNQSFAESGATELPFIEGVAAQTERLALVAWQGDAPVGAERLTALFGAA